MARSADPNQKKAYSVDSRWRVSYQRIAVNLRTLSSRGLEALIRSTRVELRKLNRTEELYVIEFILEHTSIYLHEVSRTERVFWFSSLTFDHLQAVKEIWSYSEDQTGGKATLQCTERGIYGPNILI